MSDKYGAKGTFLSNELFSRVADFVHRKGIKAGDSLPSESELCRELGVGRQQIREALSALEAVGAVQSRQGARRVWRGYDAATYAARTVTLLDDAEHAARELLEVRHALETSLLPSAAHRLTADDLAELRVLADEMVERVNSGQSFSQQDERFHRGLLAPVANGALDGILHAFWAVFNHTRPEEETVVEDPEIAAMHGRILDAIELGDTRRAVHELDAHFYGVRNRFPDISFGPTEALTP